VAGWPGRAGLGVGAEVQVVAEVQAVLVELVGGHQHGGQGALPGLDGQHGRAGDGQRHQPAYQQRTERGVHQATRNAGQGAAGRACRGLLAGDAQVRGQLAAYDGGVLLQQHRRGGVPAQLRGGLPLGEQVGQHPLAAAQRRGGVHGQVPGPGGPYRCPPVREGGGNQQRQQHRMQHPERAGRRGQPDQPGDHVDRGGDDLRRAEHPAVAGPQHRVVELRVLERGQLHRGRGGEQAALDHRVDQRRQPPLRPPGGDLQA
jgi:hypothetical protein